MQPQNSSISAQVFGSLVDKGYNPLIVQQYRFLEQAYSTNFTSSFLTEGDTVDVKSVVKSLESATSGCR